MLWQWTIMDTYKSLTLESLVGSAWAFKICTQLENCYGEFYTQNPSFHSIDYIWTQLSQKTLIESNCFWASVNGFFIEGTLEFSSNFHSKVKSLDWCLCKQAVNWSIEIFHTYKNTSERQKMTKLSHYVNKYWCCVVFDDRALYGKDLITMRLIDGTSLQDRS